MSSVTEDRHEQDAPTLARDAEIVALPRCTRCKLTYIPSKSTSALKLTYCSFLCELGDLGFSMSGLEHMELKRKEPTEPEPEAVATA
jgi:hypothetical protein